MAAAAAPVSLAATGLSAFGKISAGNTAAANATTQAYATNSADQFRAQDLSNQAEYGRVAATQTDTDLREALAGKLANIAVVSAAGNTAPGGSADAVAARTTEVGDLNRQQRVGNIQAQTNQDQLASGYYAQSGANALAQGLANAGTDQTNGWLGALGVGLGGIAGLKFDGNTSLPNNRNGGIIGFG